MARAIDGDELKNQIRHMPRTVNPDLVQYALVQAIIADMPTLTPPNEPLTLEQLREMDGEPVWIVESPDWGHWELSEDAEDYILDRDTDLYGLTYPDPDGKAGLHKLGWIAYAYPPAHIDRDSWETCNECEKKNCDNCVYSDYLSCIEPCKSCENASGWKPIQNFCGECGRPQTEEAWAMLEKRLKWERK